MWHIYLFNIELFTIQFQETENEITYLPNWKADVTFKNIVCKIVKGIFRCKSKKGKHFILLIFKYERLIFSSTWTIFEKSIQRETIEM